MFPKGMRVEKRIFHQRDTLQGNFITLQTEVANVSGIAPPNNPLSAEPIAIT